MDTFGLFLFRLFLFSFLEGTNGRRGWESTCLRFDKTTSWELVIVVAPFYCSQFLVNGLAVVRLEVWETTSRSKNVESTNRRMTTV